MAATQILTCLRAASNSSRKLHQESQNSERTLIPPSTLQWSSPLGNSKHRLNANTPLLQKQVVEPYRALGGLWEGPKVPGGCRNKAQSLLR